MSKVNDDDDDIDEDFSDPEDEPSNTSTNPIGSSGLSDFSGKGAFGNLGGGGKKPFGNMGMFSQKPNPFNDMNFGMGAGFGGGHDRFGSNMMGMRFSDHDGHARHSSDAKFQRNFLQQFENSGLLKKKEEKMNECHQPQESQEQRLARLSKKLDIPEQQQVTMVDWAIRGPAELIRLILQYILIPYKERKYVYKTKDQWFDVDRPKMRQKHPEIELPYLEDGDKIICGTEAIIIYLLHKYNRTQLLGITLDEKIKQATAAQIYWDLLENYYTLCYGEYDEELNWEKARQKYLNQKFRICLNRMVSTLKHKKPEEEIEFFWIDFAIAETVSILNEMDYRFKDQNTYLQNYVAKVFELPQFIVYRKSERFHERPYNGLGAVYR